MELIASATGSSIDFQNIPQDGESLVIIGISGGLKFNNTTTGVYSYDRLYQSGTSLTEDVASAQTAVSLGKYFRAEISNYSRTGEKVFELTDAAGIPSSAEQYSRINMTTQTPAITSIQITGGGSNVSLYKLKSGSGGTTISTT